MGVITHCIIIVNTALLFPVREIFLIVHYNSTMIVPGGMSILVVGVDVVRVLLVIGVIVRDVRDNIPTRLAFLVPDTR